MKPVHFDISHIAACGINCGTCRAYLRERNKCTGCRASSGQNIPHCSTCKIRNCEMLDKTNSKFCYECKEFPCIRIRKIDKRYQVKYRTSLIQNLKTLSITNVDTYILNESAKWTCKNCGSVLTIHETSCLNCGTEY